MTQDDFYSCSYSRATTYYIGSALGVLLGVLIMMVPISSIWQYATVVGAVAFFGASALYYDIMTKKRGDDSQEQKDQTE